MDSVTLHLVRPPQDEDSTVVCGNDNTEEETAAGDQLSQTPAIFHISQLPVIPFTITMFAPRTHLKHLLFVYVANIFGLFT